MPGAYPKFVPRPTLNWSEVGSEIVILDKEMGELLRLNSVAGFIWKQLNDQKSIPEIAQALSTHFVVEKSQAEQDTKKFLAELHKLEIVEVKNGFQDRFIKPSI